MPSWRVIYAILLYTGGWLVLGLLDAYHDTYISARSVEMLTKGGRWKERKLCEDPVETMTLGLVPQCMEYAIWVQNPYWLAVLRNTDFLSHLPKVLGNTPLGKANPFWLASLLSTLTLDLALLSMLVPVLTQFVPLVYRYYHNKQSLLPESYKLA